MFKFDDVVLRHNDDKAACEDQRGTASFSLGRQPPRFLFSYGAEDSLLAGLIGAVSPALRLSRALGGIDILRAQLQFSSETRTQGTLDDDFCKGSGRGK